MPEKFFGKYRGMVLNNIDPMQIGRLQVQGASVTEGYLNRPEANAASFTDDGWFVTGDIAAIAPDGCHRIVGRESVDLIKTGGYRVGAGEVEASSEVAL